MHMGGVQRRVARHERCPWRQGFVLAAELTRELQGADPAKAPRILAPEVSTWDAAVPAHVLFSFLAAVVRTCAAGTVETGESFF